MIYLVSSGGLGSQSTGGTPASDGGAAPAENTVKLVGAPCTQGTTLTSSVVRRYTEVAQTTQNITILQNGVLKGTIAHGSTTTVQSGTNGDSLDLFVGLESTTFYPRHFTGKIDTCTASATTGDAQFFTEANDASVGGSKIVYADEAGLFSESPNKLVQIDTAPTVLITNDGQSNQNNGATPSSNDGGKNLTIGTGSSGAVTIKLSPSANTGWGVNGNVLACQFPSAVYDSVTPLKVQIVNGEILSETDVKPSNTRYPLIQSNNTVKAYKFPGLDARKTGDLYFNIKATADANHDPAGVLDRINCTIADTSYYQKQNSGEYVLDIENRDTNVDLGGANTVYDFEIGVA